MSWKPPLTSSIVSQPSKCLKFMTFREGYFVIRNWMQVLKWSSSDFLSPLILQKMKEENTSQLGNYDAPFCEQTIHAWVLLYLFVKIQIIWSVNTPQTVSNFRHLLSCGTIASRSLFWWFWVLCSFVNILRRSKTSKSQKTVLMRDCQFNLRKLEMEFGKTKVTCWLSSRIFFRGGATKNFLGGAPSKFSGANDSKGGQKFFKENEIFTLES